MAIALFGFSSVRHNLMRSTAYDLGIYDQVVYLISQGMSPVSSFLGFHHLGNHAAWAVYPLGLLYAIAPSVYWLLGVQAVGLALGAVPTWMLARQAGVSDAQARVMALVYLSYPLIFNLNLFDFHPEVMALAALLWAIWAARAERIVLFTVAIAWVLGCKDALSLTVAAMGVWLLVFDRRYRCGAIALTAGVAWFVLVTQWMLPHFSGNEAAALNRYSYLGDSVLEAGLNLIRKPGLVLGQVMSMDSLRYISKLLLPLIWGLSPRHLAPLIGAFPAFLLNLLSKADTQRDLIHQYALPILPFFLVSVIDALAAHRTFLYQRRWILVWMIVVFLYASEVRKVPDKYTRSLDTLAATREAIALVPAQAPVMTDHRIAPHLTHRPVVKLPRRRSLKQDLDTVDYVLLDRRHPWPNREELVKAMIPQLQTDRAFILEYERDGVYLFGRVRE